MATRIEELIGVKRRDSGVLIVYADEWTLALSVEQERALLAALAREAGAVEVEVWMDDFGDPFADLPRSVTPGKYPVIPKWRTNERLAAGRKESVPDLSRRYARG